MIAMQGQLVNNMFIMFSKAIEHETISVTNMFVLIQNLHQTQLCPQKSMPLLLNPVWLLRHLWRSNKSVASVMLWLKLQLDSIH